MGRRRPALHRFRGGHCRAQHRPPPSPGHWRPWRSKHWRLRTPVSMSRPTSPTCGWRKRLNALAPGDFAKKTMFLSSGAEAVENAVKIARYSTKRSAVIAFSGGFSRPHPHDHGAHGQGHAVQARLRPVSRRGLSRGISAALPGYHHGNRRSPIWIGCFTATSIRSRSRPSSSNRCKARAASMWRPSIFCARCGAYVMSTAS